MIKIRHLMRAIGRRIFILPAAGIVSNKPEDKQPTDTKLYVAVTAACPAPRLPPERFARGSPLARRFNRIDLNQSQPHARIGRGSGPDRQYFANRMAATGQIRSACTAELTGRSLAPFGPPRPGLKSDPMVDSLPSGKLTFFANQRSLWTDGHGNEEPKRSSPGRGSATP
jgi:hypothetical protein